MRSKARSCTCQSLKRSLWRSFKPANKERTNMKLVKRVEEISVEKLLLFPFFPSCKGTIDRSTRTGLHPHHIQIPGPVNHIMQTHSPLTLLQKNGKPLISAACNILREQWGDRCRGFAENCAFVRHFWSLSRLVAAEQCRNAWLHNKDTVGLIRNSIGTVLAQLNGIPFWNVKGSTGQLL